MRMILFSSRLQRESLGLFRRGAPHGARSRLGANVGRPLESLPTTVTRDGATDMDSQLLNLWARTGCDAR